MNIRKRKSLLALLLVFALAILAAGCSGNTQDASKGPKSFTWNDAAFTVKNITDDASVVGAQADKVSGKCVAVVLDFGENEISQGNFERNVAEGKLLLAGKKPSTYNYHMSNMTLGANGFEAQLTGEAIVFFDMDPDYEISESDLEITE